jgi:phosphate starvation-inducible protein PhoH and related proteins
MADSLVTRTLSIDDRDEAVLLFGPRDQHLRALRDALSVKATYRSGDLKMEGVAEAVDQFERALQQLRQIARRHGQVEPKDVTGVIEVIRGGTARGVASVVSTEGGRSLRTRTDGQARYVQALHSHDVVICVGPAGSGKTYLAVAWAVSLLKSKQVRKIVLVRPAVEAGERLGFLPGDITAKISPYLRPLYDALADMMDPETVKKYMESEVIEILPLAFMRGRAQPVSSRVLTPAGFRPIGELQTGDDVLGSDGQPTEVLGVFPQGIKPIYRVRVTDGGSTRCCGEHLWTVQTPADKRRNKPPRVLQTQDMIGNLRSHHNHRYELPLVSWPVEFPYQDVPIDPYALGLLLGDGCITGRTTPTFATADAELVGSLQSALPDLAIRYKSRVDYVLRGVNTSRWRPNPLTRSLRDLRLIGARSGTKFVPRSYLLNSASVRLRVLQGLLDTDGGPVTQAAHTTRVQYTTTSPQLRDDVRFLVWSLGGTATVRTRAAEGRTPGFANGRPVEYRNDAFVLDIRLPQWCEPFRLPRKKAKYDEFGGGRPQRYITSITPDGEEEAVCIRVAAPDSLYVTDDFLVTHNTLSNACIILDEGQNATAEQMKMFLTRMGMNSKIVVTGDLTQIDLPRTIKSGLVDAVHRLKNVEGLSVVYLDQADIVRNPLVTRIVNAYEEDSPRKKSGG